MGLEQVSTSQITIANTSQVSFQSTIQMKICSYCYKELCPDEANHDQFKHVCAFWARQGKLYIHSGELDKSALCQIGAQQIGPLKTRPLEN